MSLQLWTALQREITTEKERRFCLFSTVFSGLHHCNICFLVPVYYTVGCHTGLFWQGTSAFPNAGLQEYVEAVTFFHYIKDSRLVGIEEIQRNLIYDEQPEVNSWTVGLAENMCWTFRWNWHAFLRGGQILLDVSFECCAEGIWDNAIAVRVENHTRFSFGMRITIGLAVLFYRKQVGWKSFDD